MTGSCCIPASATRPVASALLTTTGAVPRQAEHPPTSYYWSAYEEEDLPPDPLLAKGRRLGAPAAQQPKLLTAA